MRHVRIALAAVLLFASNVQAQTRPPEVLAGIDPMMSLAPLLEAPREARAMQETRWEPRRNWIIFGALTMSFGLLYMNAIESTAVFEDGECVDQYTDDCEESGREWEQFRWVTISGAAAVAWGLIGRRVPVAQSVTISPTRDGGVQMAGRITW